MNRLLRPPHVRPVVPPSQSPDKPRTTWAELLGKPATAAAAGVAVSVADIVGDPAAVRKFMMSLSGVVSWSALTLADLPTNASATRKFLRSVSSGAAVWDTFTAADVGSGTFPSGAFSFPGAVSAASLSVTTTLRAARDAFPVANGATLTIAGVGAAMVSVTDSNTGNAGVVFTGSGGQVMSDPSGHFSATSGTAGRYNVFNSGADLLVENLRGVAASFTVLVLCSY